MKIRPFKRQDGEWVFTCEYLGLIEEPLIDGADALLDKICYLNCINPSYGLDVEFKVVNNAGYNNLSYDANTSSIILALESVDGDWRVNGANYIVANTNDRYFDHVMKMPVWLCGNLGKFFDELPEFILVTFYDGLGELSRVVKERGFELAVSNGYFLPNANNYVACADRMLDFVTPEFPSWKLRGCWVASVGFNESDGWLGDVMSRFWNADSWRLHVVVPANFKGTCDCDWAILLYRE